MAVTNKIDFAFHRRSLLDILELVSFIREQTGLFEKRSRSRLGVAHTNKAILVCVENIGTLSGSPPRQKTQEANQQNEKNKTKNNGEVSKEIEPRIVIRPTSVTVITTDGPLQHENKIKVPANATLPHTNEHTRAQRPGRLLDSTGQFRVFVGQIWFFRSVCVLFLFAPISSIHPHVALH